MYGYTMHVEAPSESYDAVHHEVMELVAEQGGGEGLVLHLAYATAQGFDLVEVWESREHADTFNSTVMPVAMERAGVPMEGPPPPMEEFEPLGVVTSAVPAAAEPA